MTSLVAVLVGLSNEESNVGDLSLLNAVVDKKNVYSI